MHNILGRKDKIVATVAGQFSIRDFGGQGPDVLLVHGTGHNLEVWEPIAALLHKRFHVVAFDMRGHGQTPVDSKDAQEYWKDIGSIIKATELHSPILVGHSTGGYAVTAHAASCGECKAVVIVDGFVLDNRETPPGAHEWDISKEQLWEMFRYGWLADIKAMEEYINDTCKRSAKDWLNERIAPSLVARFTRRSFLHKGQKWLRRPTMEEIRIVGFPDPANQIFPSLDIYDNIQVPMAFIFAKDGLYKGRGHEVSAIAAKSKRRIFSEVDCSHNVHMQCPDKVAEMVKKIYLLAAS